MLEDVFSAAHAVCQNDELAAEVTSRVLLADPSGRPEDLAARGAMLAADQVTPYRHMDAPARDAIVLARVFGWKTDRIATQLGTTPAEIRARIGRALRTLRPPHGYADAASPRRDAHAS